MSKPILGAAFATLATFFLFTHAEAAVVAISGSMTNTNPAAAPGGRCAPALTVSIGPPFPVSGTSTFGNFIPTQSHCISAPPPSNYTNGLFSWDFGGGDVLSGIYDGTLTAAGPGLFDNVQNFSVTGGTGRFNDANGVIGGTGTVQFVSGGPANGSLDFVGELDIPDVPEPASLALLFGGFSAMGMLLRRRRMRCKLRLDVTPPAYSGAL
jgi:hypothetical protein